MAGDKKNIFTIMRRNARVYPGGSFGFLGRSFRATPLAARYWADPRPGDLVNDRWRKVGWLNIVIGHGSRLSDVGVDAELWRRRLGRQWPLGVSGQRFAHSGLAGCAGGEWRRSNFAAYNVEVRRRRASLRPMCRKPPTKRSAIGFGFRRPTGPLVLFLPASRAARPKR